jgi:hypothetical protein
MSRAFDAITYGQAALRLFRKLLRESTYLPDPVARREISRQIIHRFRLYKQRGSTLLQDATANTQSERREGARHRLQDRLRLAQQTLCTLRAANCGGRRSLQEVLLHAYGRIGRRRHALLAPLLQPDTTPAVMLLSSTPPSTATHPWDISTVPLPPVFMPPKRTSDPVITYEISPAFARLRALLHSQMENASLMPAKQNVMRAHQFQMPTKNTWGRPMPRCRVKNMAKRQFQYLRARILPPIPDDELARLQDIACGLRPCEPRPKRRARLRLETPDRLDSRDLEMILHLDNQGRPHGRDNNSTGQCLLPLTQHTKHCGVQGTWLEHQQLVDQAKDEILEEELQLGPRFAVKRNYDDDFHTLTARYMKRRLQDVLIRCPDMYRDTASGSWAVHWGRDGTRPGLNPASQAQSLLPLFERVEPARKKGRGA